MIITRFILMRQRKSNLLCRFLDLFPETTTMQNSPNTGTASGGMKLPPPVGNDFLAAYYWRHHFETGPVEPSPFIHRMMTDYADQEVVGQWIKNMSPLYKLYNACINYGLNHGSPNKSIEARKFPGVKSLGRHYR